MWICQLPNGSVFLHLQNLLCIEPCLLAEPFTLSFLWNYE